MTNLIHGDSRLLYRTLGGNMNVLSLFDGISIGMVGLIGAGIKVNSYYASEIKEIAIKCSKDNYHSIVQIGDVCKVSYENGILHTENGDYETNIDIIIGGSPCQDFSQANRERKGLEGTKSGLFYEYLRILHEVNPKYFFFENVVMEMRENNIISEALGVYPVNINSSLVSAQMRNRNYWTNIPGNSNDLFGNVIGQPKDRNIILEDILEYDTSKIEPFKNCVRKNIVNIDVLQYLKGSGFCQIPTSSGFQDHKVGITKSPCLRAGNSFVLVKCPNGGIRKITVLECERLQTIPDNFTEGISNTQRFKAIGNGWTVDVISHIFNHI